MCRERCFWVVFLVEYINHEVCVREERGGRGRRPLTLTWRVIRRGRLELEAMLYFILYNSIEISKESDNIRNSTQEWMIFRVTYLILIRNRK